MTFVRQVFANLRVSLSGLALRFGPVMTIVIGVTCAVGTLVSMLAMGTGAREQELGDVRADRVVLTSTGARSGAQSSIPRDEARTIRDMPGIRRGANGEPIVVFQSLVFVEARRRVTGARLNFPLLGISPNVTEYEPEFRLTAGRTVQPGLHELIASSPCARQFTGFEIGERRSLRGSGWLIVGQFVQGHSQQCVLYADVDAIMAEFGRTSYNQVGVMLQSPGQFEALRQAVAATPALHLEVQREAQALAGNFRDVNGLLDFVSYFVGSIMALGATLGAINSLYAMVDSRRRELATLRAIGYSPLPILVSVLCESLLLAIPGAMLGVALGWLLFNGLSASPFGYSFQLSVTPHLAVLGALWALAMGLMGGALPALRAARVPVTTALRAT